VTGNVNYEPANHEKMVRLRAAKVANIKPVGTDIIWTGPETGDVLVLGWGSTFGAIKAATLELQGTGVKASACHIRYLNPLPVSLGEKLRNFKHVLIPEMNLGQLRSIIRNRYLIDAKGLNVLGIEHSKSKMVGRGVLLDIARFRGVDWLKDGESISNDELDKCARTRTSRSGAATSSSFAPGSSNAASRKRNGAAMPAATRPASNSRTATGARRRKSPRSAPTPGASRCGRTKRRRPTSPGTGW